MIISFDFFFFIGDIYLFKLHISVDNKSTVILEKLKINFCFYALPSTTYDFFLSNNLHQIFKNKNFFFSVSLVPLSLFTLRML